MNHKRLSRSGLGHRQSGAVLPVVIIVSLIAGAISMTLLNRAAMTTHITGDLIKRKRAFYVVDGMSRILIQEIQNYMLENPNPSTEDLQSSDLATAAEVPGYTIEEYDVVSHGDSYEGPIPNGSFQGMYSRLKPISMHVKARDVANMTSSEVNLMVLLGQISMFQFFIFGNGYVDILPGPPMTVNPGRIHSNGDLCIGSYSPFKIEYLTTAGRLLASDTRCRRNSGSGAKIYTGSAYVDIDSSNSNGCENCKSTGLGWQSYALSTWAGHVRDVAHNVPQIRLPIAGSPPTQAGKNAAGGLVTNGETTRLMVDPVLSIDATDVRDQKLAWKASIRILNGVWYKNDGTWPGLPIWSDHPGSFTTANEEGIEGATARAVGQQDLASARSWSTVPTRFSYYEYDTVARSTTTNGNGVISYGSLFKMTDGSRRPGFWTAGANGDNYVDVDGVSRYSYCKACSGSGTCTASTALRDTLTAFCQSGPSGSLVNVTSSQLLQATQSGFIDFRVKASDSSRGNILPVNFDVAQFAAAMADTAAGELGSYFSGGATFNGVIYISNTWSGSMAGVPDGLATLWPAQGSLLDAPQNKARNTPMAQRGLPYPLCSDSLGYISGTRREPFSGPPTDGNATNGFEPLFTIPSCSASSSVTSRPNSVRVINAATVSATVFPKGITIATNLPLYLTGDTNTSSITTTATSTPWVPFLVAADAVTALSNNWRDANAPWDNSGNWSNRIATDTRYNTQILAGNVETVDEDYYSGGIENFVRFLEDWSSVTLTLSTSMVLGFGSVYQRFPWVYGDPIYVPPTRAWSFDLHLRALSNQPPGSPLFSVYSVSYLDHIGSD